MTLSSVTAAPICPELLSILSVPGTESELVAERTECDETQLRSLDRRHKYSVTDGIPLFLSSSDLNREKRTLKEYYEDIGWQRPEGGGFFRAQSRYGFDSPSLLRHRRIVNQEQGKFFSAKGGYFLDCASGAVPAKEYLEYSKNHDFHVCVDLTLSALAGAKERLGARGLYVNADGTKLPFRKETFDHILCSHTLYHMPRDEQADAVREFARVLRPGGRCVIFYNLGEHSLVGRMMRPLVLAKRVANRYAAPDKKMYSHHHPLSWFSQFKNEFSKLDVHTYRFLPNQVMKYGLPDNGVCNAIGNAVMPHLLDLERSASSVPYAQYVTLVMEK